MAQPSQPVMSVFEKDSGGCSTMTRLDAELSCNMSKRDMDPVTDSSLTYGDLRLLRAFVSEVGESPE